jgi:anti-anti-sigma factor
VFDVAASLTGPDDAILLVRVPRLLTHESVEPLRDVVAQRLPNRDGAGVVLDMGEVELISSIGIAALLQVFEHCRDRKAQVLIAALPQRQRDFLRMLKIDTKFRFEPTVDAAVLALAS